MIFVTVGSQLEFDRMTAAIAEWARARGRGDIYFQTGATKVDLAGFERSALLDAKEIQRKYDEASIVVAHAGTGSIIECMSRGKPIVIVPRSARLHETRNDHQFATAKRFEKRAGVFVAWNEREIGPLLDRAAELAGGARIAPYADDALISALRDFIAE